MHEGTINTGSVVAGIAWAWVLLLMAGAWFAAIMWPEQWRFAALLAFCSCASSALAAVLHIRTYVTRVCNLIRTIDAVAVNPAELRTIPHQPRHPVR